MILPRIKAHIEKENLFAVFVVRRYTTDPALG